MQIDPVIVLIEDLQLTERSLQKAVKTCSQWHDRKDEELLNLLLERLKRLYLETYETIPTSSLGAAELVRLAAKRFPFTYFRYAARLHEISDRLSNGSRSHADLVWMRALSAAIDQGALGENFGCVARWLQLAVAGAARPIIVFRAIHAPQGPPWKHIFSAKVPSGKHG